MGTDTDLTAIRARAREAATADDIGAFDPRAIIVDLLDLVEQQREEIERMTVEQGRASERIDNLDDLADGLKTCAQVAEADRDRLASALEAVRKLPEQWRKRADDITSDIEVMRDDRVMARALRERADQLAALLSPEGRTKNA